MKALLARLAGERARLEELARLAAFAVLAYIAFEAYALYRGQAWEPISFAGGLATVLAAARASSGVKAWLTPAQGGTQPAPAPGGGGT